MKKLTEKFSITENRKRIPVGNYRYPEFDSVSEAVKILGEKDAIAVLNEALKKFSRDLAAEDYKASRELQVSEKRKLAKKWSQGKLSKVEISTLQALGYGKPEDLLRVRKSKESLRQRVIRKALA